MKLLHQLLYASLLVSFSIKAQIYVATNGDDTNPGTFELPLKNIPTAVNKTQAGDTIYLRGGIYTLTIKISISKSGSENNRYHMFSYIEEKSSIGFSSLYENIW